MTKDSYSALTQLGKRVDIPASPEEATIETFENPHPDSDYAVRLTAPEFTTLCPLTGQPDFAVLIIDYVPRDKLVESKSLKLFLGSFRNMGTFHEECTVYVQKRLRDAMNPKYIRVVGLWNVRGGITIDLVVESGAVPSGCTLLPLGKIDYRAGRE
jgi:7-cyano-7-deazaguanine reductase